MDERMPYGAGQQADVPPDNQWAAAPPQRVEKAPTDWARVSRQWMIILALVVLSLSVLMALIAANQAITIWLRPQYAPLVRFVSAGVFAVGALLVVLRLTRR